MVSVARPVLHYCPPVEIKVTDNLQQIQTFINVHYFRRLNPPLAASETGMMFHEENIPVSQRCFHSDLCGADQQSSPIVSALNRVRLSFYNAFPVQLGCHGTLKRLLD